MIIQWLHNTLLVTMLLISSVSHASSQTVFAKADDVTFFNSHQTYQGHVLIQQGNTLLNAHKATTYLKNKQLVKAIALGTSKQQTTLQFKKNNIKTLCSANTIEYNPITMKVTLKGHASITRQGNILKSEEIQYDLKHKKILSIKRKQQRVRFKLKTDENHQRKTA